MIALSITALILSFLAVVVSVRQARYARQANHLPLAVDIIQWYRTPDFQDSYACVRDELGSHSPSQGLAGLPEPVRKKSLDVAYFFNSIACLVKYGVVDEKFVMAIQHFAILNSWEALRPYIMAERDRERPIGYFRFFEHLAKRSEGLPREKIWKGLEHY
ncbi:DUF4760 domain-containing protein [Frankia sp. QA3]|uniref:DUF4760 domain-containing protein n=1 Tax=Frankia sp. QA3 TaxID=710111 RepID=UPI000269BB72|nr:DUF4760 domain-containing protein [Frankia sp. QA3]EIV92633.1 hypothetical protein FraQA3DRAFT_2225 [Frankia sp. QA3]